MYTLPPTISIVSNKIYATNHLYPFPSFHTNRRSFPTTSPALPKFSSTYPKTVISRARRDSTSPLAPTTIIPN